MRVVPEATSRAPSARRGWSVRSSVPTPAGVRSLAARTWAEHRLFIIVLIPAVLLRADAELGYRWQAWFNDSFTYVSDTVHFNLDPTRVSGYSVFLKILEPFHSYALVTILQHLMGLAVAVMLYALTRHRFGAPAWLATLATVPVLYDGYEIELEHLILSDVPFLFLITLATTLLLWDPAGPSARRSAFIGLLLGLAVVLRSVGEPLLAVFVVYMIIRRFNWRKIAATVVVGAVPLVAYAGMFDLEHGQFAMSDATGVFLYSRVMTFAECPKMDVPADELWLCTVLPPDQRPIAQNFIWRSTPNTPLDRYTLAEVLPAAEQAGRGLRDPGHRGPAAGLRPGRLRRHLAGVCLDAAGVPERADLRRVRVPGQADTDPVLGRRQPGAVQVLRGRVRSGQPGDPARQPVRRDHPRLPEVRLAARAPCTGSSCWPGWAAWSWPGGGWAARRCCPGPYRRP